METQPIHSEAKATPTELKLLIRLLAVSLHSLEY